MFCAGRQQSDYFFALAAGFFVTGALVAFAAPALAFVDFAAAGLAATAAFGALVALAAPVFAFVDFGAAGFTAAVFDFVDFAAVVFAAVLFAAITIFLREDFFGTGVICRMSAGARHEQPRVLSGCGGAKPDPPVTTFTGYR